MNKILKNSMYSFTGKIFAMLFLMALDIVAARKLKLEKYAEWAFFFSILTMMFYIGWAGINTSAKVHLSRCVNADERVQCLSEAFRIRIFVSLFLSVIIAWVVPSLSSHMGYPEKYSDLKGLLYLAPILVFLNSFSEFYKEVYMGLENFGRALQTTVVEYGGYLLFSALFLCFTQGSVYGMGWGYLVSGICVSIFGIIQLRKDYRLYAYFRQGVSKEYGKQIARYAVPMAIVGLGTMILVEMDTFMLGLLSNKTEMALYSIAKNLSAKATHINYALAAGAMTSFSVVHSENYEKKRQEFRRVSRLNLLIAGIVALFVLILAPQMIEILYGNAYGRAGEVMRMLMPYYMLYTISNFHSFFLDFRGKAKLRSIFYVMMIILNLVFNYLLIPGYGAYGAAIATGCSLIPYTIMTVAASKYEWNHILEKECY